MTAPAAPMHDVKSASAVLADDVICQSFVQSSSTLAYACILIRNGNYDLAIHVLHSLEAKQASRFKDMVFYLQSQIGIETGEFATVKRRLLPRVHQHPNDMVALSLLECCIYLEFVEWEKRHPFSEPAHDSGRREVQASLQAAKLSGIGEIEDPVRPGPAHRVHSNPLHVNSEADFAASLAPQPAAPNAASPESRSDHDPLMSAPPPVSAQDAPRQPAPSRMPAAPAASRVQYAQSTGTPMDMEFGQFQTLVNDANTQALVLWNPEKGYCKSSCRNAELESLTGMLPHEVPMPIQAACTSLDCGVVTKISFSFQQLTVTSFHAGSENLGLVTGNINQSLLTIVRAENTFRKLAASVRPAE
ncbi:MAG: hypothetical protein ABIW76_10125 [Fibrobacteria bacterium]